MTHRTHIARNHDVFALQQVRDQIGKKVYPIHRLDSKTSGVLIFALDSETNAIVQAQFASKETQKVYHAIVRGYFPKEIIVDHPVENARGKMKEAVTNFSVINRSEIDVPSGKFQTSRYSLVEARPETGRMHQIRRHLNHLRHPIIGDRPHGCNKQNRLFKKKWDMITTMLHAKTLTIDHPFIKRKTTFVAEYSEEFIRVRNLLKL